MKMGRIKQPISKRETIIWGIVGVAVLVVIYSFLSHRQHVRNPTDTTLPNIQQLFEGLKDICTPHTGNPLAAAFGLKEKPAGFFDKITTTWLFEDAWATYARLFKGLMWGCFLSVVLGTLMGCYERLASFLIPPLSFLAKVPGTAMLAVFFVIVGTGEGMFVTMIGFGIMPTLTQAIYLSARDDLHSEEVDKAYTLGASNYELIWNIVFPKILPKILDNVRLQIGPAMVYLIAAEMLVGQVGMGYQIRMQQRLLNMAVVYNYLFILGVTGLLMDRAMISLRKWLCPWYGR
jgi:ABC-type nitrate/sulfonate/bicarbonate transport system permease component